MITPILLALSPSLTGVTNAARDSHGRVLKPGESGYNKTPSRQRRAYYHLTTDRVELSHASILRGLPVDSHPWLTPDALRDLYPPDRDFPPVLSLALFAIPGWRGSMDDTALLNRIPEWCIPFTSPALDSGGGGKIMAYKSREKDALSRMGRTVYPYFRAAFHQWVLGVHGLTTVWSEGQISLRGMGLSFITGSDWPSPEHPEQGPPLHETWGWFTFFGHEKNGGDSHE